MNDVMTNRWIKTEIGFSAYANSLMQSREFLKNWAKELGWEYKEGKKIQGKEDSRPCYPLSISPKEGKISPSEFEEEADKIITIAEQIAQSFGNVNEYGVPVFTNTFFFSKLMEAGKKEAVEMVLHRYGVLALIYPLYRRRELEKINIELAKTIFVQTAEKEINLMPFKIKISEHFFNKGKKEEKKRVQERLKNWFNIDIY